MSTAIEVTIANEDPSATSNLNVGIGVVSINPKRERGELHFTAFLAYDKSLYPKN